MDLSAVSRVIIEQSKGYALVSNKAFNSLSPVDQMAASKKAQAIYSLLEEHIKRIFAGKNSDEYSVDIVMSNPYVRLFLSTVNNYISDVFLQADAYGKQKLECQMLIDAKLGKVGERYGNYQQDLLRHYCLLFLDKEFYPTMNMQKFSSSITEIVDDYSGLLDDDDYRSILSSMTLDRIRVSNKNEIRDIEFSMRLLSTHESSEGLDMISSIDWMDQGLRDRYLDIMAGDLEGLLRRSLKINKFFNLPPLILAKQREIFQNRMEPILGAYRKLGNTKPLPINRKNLAEFKIKQAFRDIYLN